MKIVPYFIAFFCGAACWLCPVQASMHATFSAAPVLLDSKQSFYRDVKFDLMQTSGQAGWNGAWGIGILHLSHLQKNTIKGPETYQLSEGMGPLLYGLGEVSLSGRHMVRGSLQLALLRHQAAEVYTQPSSRKEKTFQKNGAFYPKAGLAYVLDGDRLQWSIGPAWSWLYAPPAKLETFEEQYITSQGRLNLNSDDGVVPSIVDQRNSPMVQRIFWTIDVGLSLKF